MRTTQHYIHTHAVAIAPVHPVQHELDIIIYIFIIAIIISTVYSCVTSITETFENLLNR